MAQEKSHLHFCFFTNNKVKVDIDGRFSRQARDMAVIKVTF